MFGEVRSHFGDRWLGLRERGTLRLFAFEFFVVVLGVLAAQALANWAEERDRQTRADIEIDRMMREFAEARETVAIWDAALPCLRSQVLTIMRDAGDGKPIDPALLSRPALWSTAVTTPGPDTVERLRHRFGDNVTTHALVAVSDVNSIDTGLPGITDNWYQFARLDPANGRIRETDIAAARQAAGAILATFRVFEVELDSIKTELDIAKAPPMTRTRYRDGTVRPARTCAEIVAAKAIAIPVAAEGQ